MFKLNRTPRKPVPKSVQDSVRKVPYALRKASLKQPQRVSFRTSSFPICARQVALYNLRIKAFGAMMDRRTFRSDSYFAAGHAAHETVQFWLGILGFLYGIWYCKHHTKVREGNVETRTYCGYEREGWGTADPCPLCKAEGRESFLNFREYKLAGAGPIKLDSAYTDGLTYLGEEGLHLPIRNIWPNTVAEFKTCSQSFMDKLKKQDPPEPKSRAHHEQASGYCEQVEHLFRDKWEGWNGIEWIMYGYINRNHPWQVFCFAYHRLHPGIVRSNAIRFHIGRMFPDEHQHMPRGRCTACSDAEGFSWYGEQWMGCGEKDTCFGRGGDGGLYNGETPAWVESALKNLKDQ